MFDTYAIADRVARYATGLGYAVSQKNSQSSGSTYLIVAHICDACRDGLDTQCACGDEIKIRIATHELPPTYGLLNGYADYEIGPPDSGLRHGWAAMVAKLADLTGQDYPPTVKAYFTRIANIREKNAHISRPHGYCGSSSPEAVDAITAELIKCGKNHLTGNARRNARKTIRRKLGLVGV